MAQLDASLKLASLRELMRERNIDVYVIPSEDAHSSEYLAPCDARRAWLTGFTGSAGCAVVTLLAAYCWTDGRYWLQAANQLGDQWTLMKQGLPEVPTWTTWLKNLGSSIRVGIDPHLLAHSEAGPLCTALASDPSRALVPVKDNLVDMIWGLHRPTAPANAVFRLSDDHAGETVQNKLAALRDRLNRTGSPGTVISNLDEVAWLFNLRGSDIPYNPVFFAYSIITKHDCTLFTNPIALPVEVREYLHANNVAVLEYSQVWSALESWGELLRVERKDGVNRKVVKVEGSPVSSKDQGKEDDGKDKVIQTDKVLIGNKTSWAVAKSLGEDNVEVRRSMVEDAKARKNATEIEGFRQSHIRDGVALVRYLAWLEEVLAQGERWTEYDAAEVLEGFRSENKWFMGLSFDTISSTGANAAVIHYSPPKEGSAVIDPNSIYLCDSGAQYLDGTTDVTRTVHFGVPTEEEKRAFTRVLQGHIALDTMIFPANTTGYVLDTIARRPLWSDGLDYRHGTGHGVGHFLNVHEGPQGIGPRVTYNDTGLVEGMVISNEPGYYADGKFGIRIESVVGVRNAQTLNNYGGKGYLEFECFTMCPIQTSLINLNLITREERNWINSYHAEVFSKLSKGLKATGDERAVQWLERQCEPV